MPTRATREVRRSLLDAPDYYESRAVAKVLRVKRDKKHLSQELATMDGLEISYNGLEKQQTQDKGFTTEGVHEKELLPTMEGVSNAVRAGS